MNNLKATAIQVQIDHLREQERRLAELLLRIKEQPEDDYPDGAVIVFQTTRFWHSVMGEVRGGGTGQHFTYAALKVGGHAWYLTGKCQRSVDWDELLELVDGNPIWYVTEMEEQG